MAKEGERIILLLKILVGLLAVLSLALLVAVIVLSTKGSTAVPDLGFCSEESKLASSPPRSSGLYDDLSKEEIIAVRDYILRQSPLNVTPHKNAVINSNYIYLIELQQPQKDKAIDYLENKNARPERTARVIIFCGGESVPVVKEYLVSPADKPTRHERSVGPGQKDPIPFYTRVQDSIEVAIVEQILLNVTKHARSILHESYDGYIYSGCTQRCLTWSYSAPGALEKGERKTWVWFLRDLQGMYLHPVGFEVYINTGGSDVSLWGVEKVFYHNQSFDSVEELVLSYESGAIYKVFLPAPSHTGETPLYSSFLRRGDSQSPKPLRRPEIFEPDGKRYTVSGRHVEYMKWSFDFRSRSSSGLQLFDIRFDGQRIVYELSLQEAAAFYSSWSPMQMFTEYLDTFWGMGYSKFELVAGVDCPIAATFFDVIHHVDRNDPARYRNAICLFEHDLGIPLRRHFANNFDGGYYFYGGMGGNALVLRSVSTPFNYDYIYDYLFYANGVLEVRVATTGYVQSTYWTSNEAPYGNEIYPQVAGSVHDHLFSYKVDLDIVGTKNSFETIDIEVENITNPWFPSFRRVQKVLRRRLKKTEQEAIYRYKFDNPKYLNFFSDGNVNNAGVNRGYRIHIRDMAKQMYPEGWELVKGAGWSLNQMTVTKRHESEERSTSIYNQNSMTDPVVDFQQFVADNEAIVNEDLVAWVTVGVMHIPHSEDVPVTATAANSASFFLRPYNYFDQDPSMASHDAVLILPRKDGASQIDTFGTPSGPACAPRNKSIDFKGVYGDF